MNDNIAYAAYSKSKNVREPSSSGGVFTELANNVLAQNGVVFGAAYATDFSIEHIMIMDKSDLPKLQGAKYAKSKLGDTFQHIKDHLESGRMVLFCGTPCQVFSLKQFLRVSYDKLVCLDFVCHGAPVDYAWRAYVSYRAQVDNKGILPDYINMRSKNTGWSRFNYSVVFKYQNKVKYSALSYDDLYMRLFIGNHISMKACSHCRFKGYDRVSDITLGDFWGIWDVCPDMDDNMGTSLVITHSNLGEQVFSSIKDNLVLRKVSLQNASKKNPSLLSSSCEADDRDEVLRKIREGRFSELNEVFPRPKGYRAILKRLRGKLRRRKLVNEL